MKKREHSRVLFPSRCVANILLKTQVRPQPQAAGGLRAVLGESESWASTAHQDRRMDERSPAAGDPGAEGVAVRADLPHAAPPPSSHTSEPRALPDFPFPPSGSRSLPPSAHLSPTAILTSLLPHPSLSSMVRGGRKVPAVGSGAAPSPSQDRRGRTWTQLHPVLLGFRGLRSHSAW